MPKTNIQIVREYIEQVTNAKRFDLVYDYCSKNAVLRGFPYIGLGIVAVSSPGEKMIIQRVFPDGPAAGHLQEGDEVVSVQDAAHTWNTFAELDNNPWGPGKLGDKVTLTVRRNGVLMGVPLVRARMEGTDVTIADYLEWWKDATLKEWPDLHEEIVQIIGQDDYVAYFGILNGSNAKFHTTSVFTECFFIRLEAGKIVEFRGVSDDLAVLKQLAYQITAPVMEAG